MILLDLELLSHGYVALRCAYDEAAIAQFKAVPGCRWDPDERAWVAPIEAGLILSRRLERAKIAETRTDVVQSMDQDPFDHPDLYDYQNEGVSFIESRVSELKAALLADDLGVGKSAQTLRAIDELGIEDRVLILCPAVVVEHWRAEIEKWLGDWISRGDNGQTSTRLNSTTLDWSGFGVMSYDTFRSATVEKVNGKTQADPTKVGAASVVVLDEIHYLASGKSQRSKAVRAYLDHCEPKAVIGLSGTPMMVRPKDLHNPLDLLWPGRFGSWFQFTKRYADGRYADIPGLDQQVWKHDGASNLEELAERLKPLMLRRTRAQVLKDLPSRQRIVIPVEIPKEALKSMTSAYAGVTDSDSVQKMLGASEGHKLKAAVELARDLQVQGHRPLVLCTRKATASDLGKQLKCNWVTGETPPGKRKDKLLAGSVAVATIYSITTGINLTEFDTAIFVGLDWVPSTLLQAEGRLVRIGQKRSVVFYYLIGLGSIDEVVRSAVVERLEHFVELIGGIGSDEEELGEALGRPGEEDLIKQIVESVREMSTWKDRP